MSEGRQVSGWLVPGILLMLAIFVGAAWVSMGLLMLAGWSPLGSHRYAGVAAAFGLGGIVVYGFWRWAKKL